MAKLILENKYSYKDVLSTHGYRKTPRKDQEEYEHKDSPDDLIYVDGSNWSHDHEGSTKKSGTNPFSLHKYLKVK